MKVKAFLKFAFASSLLISTNFSFAQSNFLIGVCSFTVATGAPAVTSCSVPDLAARPVFQTIVQLYKPNSVTFMLIWGRKNSLGDSNKIYELKARYQVVDSNTVIATISSPTGCITRQKFIRSGSEIFKEDLPPSGNCVGGQMRAIQEGIERGREKVSFIK
jgi:hypothetical protein